MQKESYNVIGVMSGTSLDGIDLAHIRFTLSNGNWAFSIAQCQTVAYAPEWTARLQHAVSLDPDALAKLDNDYTLLLGKVISDFIQSNEITALDAVCSHGHTVLHQPQAGVTLQIGNRPGIAALANQCVVCDFRVQDVALGGQGAPLVPIGDRLLFGDHEFCLNLGGFSNISFEQDGKRIAYDISPVNTVLNFYANRLGKEYDDKGAIAAAGNLDEKLLAELDALPFYARPYPKSLGIEFVNEQVLPLIESHRLDDRDKLRSFTEHIARQLSFALPNRSGSMLLTGGGAYNDFLVRRIEALNPKIAVKIPDRTLLEFKEALIFGLLGLLRLRGENNVLASVTGARHDHCSGVVYQKP